jgi:NADH:ubiquinone oxidoreductase subunit E
MLHGIQDALGYVPAQAVPAVAEALNLSRAEVHGVISYYHHFRAEAPGRHVVQVCRAEACQARGGEGLWAHACESAGVDKGHGGTSADGALTVLPVYCLGLCAMSPAVAVDEKVHARISQARYDRLVQNLNPLEA